MGPFNDETLDSPSRQLLRELNQLAINSTQGLYARLEARNAEQKDAHHDALAEAARKHEQVRRNAETEKRRIELEKEAEEREEGERQRRALEKQRHDNELAERVRHLERIRIAEERERELARADKAAQELKDRRAEDARREAEEARRQQEELESKRRQQEEAAAAAAAAAKVAAAERAAQQHAAEEKSVAHTRPETVNQEVIPSTRPAVAPNKPASSPRPNTGRSNDEITHARYLRIHHDLKVLRKTVTSNLKEHAAVKAAVGDIRRDIRKSVGQLTAENRRKPLSTVITALKKALTFPEPKVNVAQFLAQPLAHPPTDPDGPAILLYLLNIFAKAIIAQFVDEASVNPLAADAVGVVASHIFALDDFRWNRMTLIDILIAKFHVVAPALFGIRGRENTTEGKVRLGWWREEGRHEGPFVVAQRHFERMTGLGAGFAALTLRNYEKARVENPYPDRHYWEALARISNLPPEEVTQTHFVLLKGLIENFENKFIGFYGGAAKAALRLLLVDLPSKCPPSATCKSLAGLKDVLERDMKLFL